MTIAIEITFWVSLAILFYSYLGYGVVLYLLVKFKRTKTNKAITRSDDEFTPLVTVLIAAYNEKDYIEKKIDNTLALDYPKDKINYLIVTDGSDDGTEEIVKAFPQIQLLHQAERKGKIAAVHRAMAFVKTPFIIFTDANTMLNPEAVKSIVRHYKDDSVGAVAGEKRILNKAKDAASGAGEGFYWKYESALKKWDSELYSVVGAAGELFSIRSSVYEAVPKDTIIEDFYMTLRIAQKGYRVIYEPEAYAVETASASVKEELKRKIRIANGGIQAIIRLKELLNPFKYGILSFQYISHRVLRWTIAPAALPVLFLLNIYLAFYSSSFYIVTLILQISFYLSVLLGQVLESRKIKIKVFFIPFYFFIMNYAVYIGFIRYLKGTQSVLWEKAKREL